VKSLILTAACVLALVACDKPSSTEVKADDPTAKNTTTTNATATAAATAAPTPAPVTIDDSVLSTPADFEEAAEKAITPKTYKAELATLEADLAKD
jgi:hypothetical protein